MTSARRHREAIQKHLRAWSAKRLLQDIYRDFYQRTEALLDPGVKGPIVEIGSGIGSLKQHRPDAICTDLFPNPWLDLVCDAYELPFAAATLSHLVLVDVFHHLRAPRAFLKQARSALAPAGRVIILDPYISWTSAPVYGLLHHEPVAWRKPISMTERLERPRNYYEAQGNATRLFFLDLDREWLDGWQVVHAEAFSAWSYLLSGGYTKPALYPRAWLKTLQLLDLGLSRWPRCFGGRCLVALVPQ